MCLQTGCFMLVLLKNSDLVNIEHRHDTFDCPKNTKKNQKIILVNICSTRGAKYIAALKKCDQLANLKPKPCTEKAIILQKWGKTSRSHSILLTHSISPQNAQIHLILYFKS